ncbi:MAG TPA: polyribonucleotide nucleotidyltransferase, partial [Treponemataceae bacterium]|nr:polyribonucleotide nucleotidyltransferase [Treponemataceae bacterium]
MIQRVTYKIGNEELILETGRIAKQANGSVLATIGGTTVIATVCASSSAQEGLDYVPVTVDYNEKYYAAGKIPGGFMKREGRPKDKEIIVSRLIDRPMRPLFDISFGREIQIIPTCISADGIHSPDVLAVIAVSAAVTISDIPFNGPIAAVRVGYIAGEYVVNPTIADLEKSEIEIIVAGTANGFTMVEGGAQEVSEELMLGAIAKAEESLAALCHLQEDLKKVAGKEKLLLNPLSVELENKEDILAEAMPKMEVACFMETKFERSDAIKAVKKEFAEKYAEQLEDDSQKKLFNALFDQMNSEILRKSILDNNKRVDGRGLEDVRAISCEIDVLERPHGAALFTRGETQALAVTTLGTSRDEQILDDIDGDRRENFMLHYNFPPYSVGECGRLSTGRREIGHGHLALRALYPMLPSKDDFPYTIRVVSEIMESNGSSSMASVCGGSLSLLAAGVPMKKSVAGIAMGLITEGETYDKYAVLTDILGEEDHLGDMDFKVAGTEDGITAFQMDIKIAGVTTQIMTKALDQAKRARLHILGEMNKVIDKPRAQLSENAPKIETMKIPIDKIGALIGPGGKIVKALCTDYDVTINTDDDGTVTIYGTTGKATDAAKAAIKGIVEDPEVGVIYNGVVKRLMDFGAFVEILPGKEGLCHISKFSRSKIGSVSEVVKEGQKIPVKLLEIDRMGRLNLSYIDAIEE